MLVSLIAASLLAFVPAAFAQTAGIKASTIESPLLGPGSTFTVDVTGSNFVDLWYVSFVLTYDSSILQAASVSPVRGSPTLLTHVVTADVSTPGVVALTADRDGAAGFTDTSGFQILLGLVNFKVVGRGVSALHFSSAVFQDNLGNAIPVTPADGSFDNRLQGDLTTAHVLDTSLVGDPNNPSFFAASFDISAILPAHPIGGYQFTVSFDPNMLLAVGAEIVGGFDPTPVFMDIQADHVTLAASGGNLASTGTVANVFFAVIGNGVTQLSLSDVRGVDIYGHPLVFTTEDGSLANVANIAVALNTVFVANRKWSVSLNGPSFTLTDQVTSYAAGLTKVRAHFVIFDRLGAVVADLRTDGVDIMPGTTIRVSGNLDVAALATNALYVVQASCEYVDSNGMWVLGAKGSPTGARTSMIKSFELLP